jgi:hypothetical protein
MDAKTKYHLAMGYGNPGSIRANFHLTYRYYFHMESAMHVNRYGDQEWQVDGQLHRTDGPAYIGKSGYQAWFVNGERHRTDGPAIIGSDGAQAWFVNGQRHRTDGPAIIRSNGAQEWYINDRDITREVKSWMRKQKVTWPWDAETQTQFVLTFS